jgi:hypothetical protein
MQSRFNPQMVGWIGFLRKEFPSIKGKLPKEWYSSLPSSSLLWSIIHQMNAERWMKWCQPTGYPDMGNGRYAAKLSDEDWVTFNNYQRAHYNYIEGIAVIVILTLMAGIWYPRLAVITGIAYIIGRQLYAIGYQTGGGMIPCHAISISYHNVDARLTTIILVVLT